MSNKLSTTLYQLQSRMAAAIMRPLDNDDMQATWIDGTPTSAYVNQFIKPNKKLSSCQRLEIYNRQYWYRLLESLQEDFPGLNALLGHSRFEKLSVAYLSRYPSRSHTLNNLGCHLATFIKEAPHYTEPDCQAAYDLASIEWAEIRAFDAEAKKPLKAQSLQKMSPEKIVLQIQPYITILNLGYAVDTFLLAINKEHNKSVESNAVTERTIRFKKAIQPKKQRVYVAVHRLNNTLYYKRLDKDQFVLLSSLIAGKSLAEACSDLINTKEKSHLQEKLLLKINKSFATWMELGWFCDLDSQNA